MNITERVLFGVIATLASASAQNFGFCIPDQVPPVPDATMTVSKTPQGFFFDHRISDGTGYSLDCDPYYTVDLTVPGSYNVPLVGNAVDIGGGSDGATTQLTQANCPDASVSVFIYKRTIIDGTATAWKLVNKQIVKAGTWVPFVDSGQSPYCALSVAHRVVASGLPFAYDQYRVKVLPMLFGSPVQARVDWEWTY